MAALGIGVRVRTGWSPSYAANSIALSEGIVTSGPYDKGFAAVDPNCGHTFFAKERSWDVDMGDPHPWLMEESMLFPIDGGDPVETEHDKEIEA